MEVTRKRLDDVAREKALLPFHGYIDGKESNIEPIVKHFISRVPERKRDEHIRAYIRIPDGYKYKGYFS